MSTIPKMGRSAVEAQFAKRVKFEREARDWSQADLARSLTEHLGQKVYPTTIAKIESLSNDRPRSIRLDEAVALSQAFDMPLGELVMSDPSPERNRADIARLIESAAWRAGASIDDAAERLYDILNTAIPDASLLVLNLETKSEDEVRDIIGLSRLAALVTFDRGEFYEAVGVCLLALKRIVENASLDDEALRQALDSRPSVSSESDGMQRLRAIKQRLTEARGGQVNE